MLGVTFRVLPFTGGAGTGGHLAFLFICVIMSPILFRTFFALEIEVTENSAVLLLMALTVLVSLVTGAGMSGGR